MITSKEFMELYLQGKSAQLHRKLTRAKARDTLKLQEVVKESLLHLSYINENPIAIIIWLNQTAPDEYFDDRIYPRSKKDIPDIEQIDINVITSHLVRAIQSRPWVTKDNEFLFALYLFYALFIGVTFFIICSIKQKPPA